MPTAPHDGKKGDKDMNRKKVLKYCGRAVTWKPVASQLRYSAEKRTALDGKVWWCIFDHKERKYIAGSKYRMMAECRMMIGRKVRAGELPTDKSDFYEDPNGFKKGKHKFVVDVHWDVARTYEVEAESADEAQKIIQAKVDAGEICVWTDGFEATDDCEVKTSGEEKNDGSLEFYE